MRSLQEGRRPEVSLNGIYPVHIYSTVLTLLFDTEGVIRIHTRLLCLFLDRPTLSTLDLGILYTMIVGGDVDQRNSSQSCPSGLW